MGILITFMLALQLVFVYIYCSRKQLCKFYGHIDVVVPTYNEGEDALQNTLASIRNQCGPTCHIIVVDDGSKTPPHVPEWCELVTLPHNQGKRAAQIEAMKHVTSEFVVFVDSDTVLEPDAISRLLGDVKANGWDAACGLVVVRNREQNWLTRIAYAMYHTSFLLNRTQQSVFGSVLCCSGALSCYRSDLVRLYADEYLGQTCAGVACKAGDDRCLTTLFLLGGSTVGFSRDAVAYTDSPATLRILIKQQLRWFRSSVAIYDMVCRKPDNWSLPYVFFNLQSVFRVFYVAAVWFSMFFCVVNVFLGLLAAIAIFSVGKWCVLRIMGCDIKLLECLAYSAFTFFVLTPVLIFASLTCTRSGWITR